jgi:hypothetical protein
MPGVVVPAVPNTPIQRRIGAVLLDSPPNATVREILPAGSRSIIRAQISDRRRTTRIKEDTTEQSIEVRGFWRDLASGLRFRDFAAALLNQSQVRFDLGDGTEYRMVDVEDVLGTRLSGVERDGPGQEGDQWAYVAKVLSYEPYTRARNPILAPAIPIVAAVGSARATFDVAYNGTAPGEPTWQFTLSVPAGMTVTQVKLENTTSGQACIIPGLNLTNGRFVIIIDASGSDPGTDTVLPRTPGNNEYGLIAFRTSGYGACIGTPIGPVVDWALGRVPTAVTPNPTQGTQPAAITDGNDATYCIVGGAGASYPYSVVIDLGDEITFSSLRLVQNPPGPGPEGTVWYRWYGSHDGVAWTQLADTGDIHATYLDHTELLGGIPQTYRYVKVQSVRLGDVNGMFAPDGGPNFGPCWATINVYGARLGAIDIDFSGTPPQLVGTPGAIPAVARVNHIIASLVLAGAPGALNNPSEITFLAPTRYVRL